MEDPEVRGSKIVSPQVPFDEKILKVIRDKVGYNAQFIEIAKKEGRTSWWQAITYFPRELYDIKEVNSRATKLKNALAKIGFWSVRVFPTVLTDNRFGLLIQMSK